MVLWVDFGPPLVLSSWLFELGMAVVSAPDAVVSP